MAQPPPSPAGGHHSALLLTVHAALDGCEGPRPPQGAHLQGTPSSGRGLCPPCSTSHAQVHASNGQLCSGEASEGGIGHQYLFSWHGYGVGLRSWETIPQRQKRQGSKWQWVAQSHGVGISLGLFRHDQAREGSDSKGHWQGSWNLHGTLTSALFKGRESSSDLCPLEQSWPSALGTYQACPVGALHP